MIKRITVPIYNRRLVFVDTEAEARQEAHRLRTAGEREGLTETASDWKLYGFTGFYDRTVFMFVNRKKKHPGGVTATVVHECVHAAGMVLGYAGVSYDHENDEQLAYLVDWIFIQWQRRMG